MISFPQNAHKNQGLLHSISCSSPCSVSINAGMFLRPQVFRVLPLGSFASNGIHHQRLVLPVGNAEPFIGAAQHLDLGLVLLDQLGHHQRQEILALERICRYIFVEPRGEAADKLVETASTTEPDAALTAKYEARYQNFKKLYPALKDFFAATV